jgi:glycosyltransferase involved in cell wall biosynthesis
MTFVSVVIPTKSRRVAVCEAVRSVLAQTYEQFELIVVDQTPDDATRDALRPFFADRRVHYRVNRRPGYGAASSRNIAIALASGEIVAIIDDDVTAPPDWLAKIVAEFEADPELQFIPGRLTAPEYDRSAGYTPEFCPYPGLSKWRLITVAAGANFSMRRSLLDRVGGYDEFCGPGSRLGASDDADLTLRIVQSGAKWKACPEIEVIHTYGFRPQGDGVALARRYQRGNGGVYGRAMRRGHIVPGLWFFAREGYYLARDLVALVSGRDRPDFNLTRERLIGFWNGFRLSPHQGFVSGEDLARMRLTLSAVQSG